MLDSRPKGRGFEPHRRHWVVSLSKNINPSLLLVQPRKTRPYITERLLMGRKESNQTNKQTDLFKFLKMIQYLGHIHSAQVDGTVVNSLLQLSERWPCHIWLVGRMKFATLEANFGGVGTFSLSHSCLFSPSLWEESQHHYTEPKL